MSTMYAASFEAMYSAFSRMHVQKTWEGILNAPVALDDIVFAEMLWAGLKSLFSAIAIALVLVALDISRSPRCWSSLPRAVPDGLTFSSIALVFNALAKGYDFFMYYFTLVLTPMTFLSGVFFPIEHMPGWLQARRVRAAVDGRGGTRAPAGHRRVACPLAAAAGLLLAYAAVGYWVALVLTRRRFFR